MFCRVLAIARLRLQVALHAMRKGEGVLNTISSAIVTILGGLLSVGLAVGFGALALVTGRVGDREPILFTYLVVFFCCAVFGMFVPLLFAAQGQAFELRRLLIFPLSRGQLYGISLGSAFLGGEHLFYYPILLSVSWTGIVLPGRQVLAGLAILLFFAVLVVTWSHAFMLLLQGFLRRRRGREIAGLVIFLVIIVASMLPMLLTGLDSEGELSKDEGARISAALERTIRSGRFLPPVIAASGVQALQADDLAGGLRALSWLLIWIVLGAAAGHFVFTRHILGDGVSGSVNPVRRGSVDTATAAEKRSGFDATDLPLFSREVLGVAAKELAYLRRSVLGKFNLLMAPVVALIVIFVFARDLPNSPIFGVDPEIVALFGMLMYMTLFSNNFVNNAFAWESSGIKLYFLSPSPLDRVLLGKNLGVWASSGVSAVLALLLWFVFKGVPSPLTLVSSLLAFACCQVMFTAVGNFVSVQFPVARDSSSMMNSPSSAAILIGLITFVVVGALISLAALAPVLLGYPGLQPLAVGLLLAVVLLIYRWSLKLAGRFMGDRAEALVEALRSS